MSNDKEVTSAGKEPRPESGQQLFEKLVAVGDSHAKVVLPMRSEREIRELLDKMRAGTRLDNASPRETPERGRRIQAIKEVFTLERAKNLCKACFGDTDVDGVMMLHAMTERTLACFTRFLLAVRDDEKTAAATAINDLLGTEEGNGAIEILSAVLALYGDYLPHGDPVRVLFNKHDVDPLRAPTVCHAVLKLATLVEEGTREAIRLQMKLGVRESKDLSVPALTAHAMTLWPWVRDWFHNIELNYVDLHLLLEKEFAAARQLSRQSLGAAGKPAETTPPDLPNDLGGGDNRYENLSSLQPSHRKAYLSFLYAEAKVEKRLEDRDAHDWLRENGIDGGTSDELNDYKLPAYDTWSRYVRVARKATGEQKYTPRSGRTLSG